MSIADAFLPEFDQEMSKTRQVLERVPEADHAWKPHPKSFSMGELALHLANIPTWTAVSLTQSEFDMNPDEPPDNPIRDFESVAALLATLDKNVKDARDAIASTDDQTFMADWTLKDSGKALFTMPRAAVIRSFVINHVIHHRGQLTVYLRLRDVPLPFIYGPTADTPK